MAVNISRSQRASLHDGMTDGKYRKRRPDTEPTVDSALTQTERASLHPWMNYGFINGQSGYMVAGDGSSIGSPADGEKVTGYGTTS